MTDPAQVFNGGGRGWLPWSGRNGRLALGWACIANGSRRPLLEATFEGVAATRHRLLVDWTNGHWQFLEAVARDLAGACAQGSPGFSPDLALLQAALDARPEISELAYVAADGRVVASTCQQRIGSEDDQPGALAAGLAAPFLHGPYVDARTLALGATTSKFHDAVTLMFRQPVRSEGRTLGCLCARVPNDVMSDLIQREAGHVFPDSGDNYLFMAESRFDRSIRPGTALSRSRFEDRTFTGGDNLRDGVHTRWGTVRVAAHTEFELVFNDPATGTLHPGVQETIRRGSNLFAGYPGSPDYRHVPVIGKGITFSLPGSPDRWGMMCEADLEEACRMRPPGYRSMRAFCGLALATAALDALLRHAIGASPAAHAMALGAWAVAAAWLFHRWTVAPMARAIETMSAHFLHIAECGGPLSGRLHASSLAEDGSAALARWINSFVDRTEETVRSVSAATARLGLASDELAGTSNAIAAASRQQSESAADAASAVEEVTVSVAHVADNAAIAARLSDVAGEASDAGHQVVGRTARDVEAIAASIRDSSTVVQRLGERSQQIDGIARTIHDIAGQTNLLALNAAIEAARAGEQGRGFAVVADEVRKLAERTSRSTQEIAEVIASIIGDTTSAVATMSGCTDKAGAGVEQAAAAAHALEGIGRSVAENRTMIREIAEATGAQRIATEGIAHCIEEIARMSEANAQAVGEAEAAARRLQYLAVDLRKSVARFEAAPVAGGGSARRKVAG